ncbi:winged helix DNA-binding protein [Herbiconiux sp. CPCC 205763]|uniref:Winged helix DNA-binding protein n=1 Tax=Herbiconiux aconitum TaxID=2970913 RepID=A0ABT2GNL4_9MICO|nr:winged helix DNA-binding protein [Herbiconiux aconitum]MCS5717809.1 winged helix DNA-binding protein [Herbiconiux aconitum]
MRRAEQIRYLVLALQREGDRQLASALRPLGLTPSQAEAIRVVAEFGPLSLQHVGRLLICENGTNPSRLIDRLVDAGLVSREVAPDDRRRVTLSLTPAGRAAETAVRAIEEQLYQQIDAALEAAAGAGAGATRGEKPGPDGDADEGRGSGSRAQTDVDAAIALLAALAGGTPAAEALEGRGVGR